MKLSCGWCDKKRRPRDWDQGTRAVGQTEDKFSAISFFLFPLREGSQTILHKRTSREKMNPIYTQKVSLQMKMWVNLKQKRVDGFFFSALSMGELINPQRDQSGQAVSRDSLISSATPDGQESHFFRKGRALKTSQAFKTALNKTESRGARRSGSPPGLWPADQPSTSASRSAFQTPVLGWVWNVSNFSPGQSYWKHYLFHQ